MPMRSSRPWARFSSTSLPDPADIVAGMPALRVCRSSLNPVAMVGMMGTPGHIECTSERHFLHDLRGGGRFGTDDGRASTVTRIGRDRRGRRRSRCTLSAESPGSMRHWMVALARCGSAFSAWPPEISVATQVVRSCAFRRTFSLRRSAAARSGGDLRDRVHVRRRALRSPERASYRNSRESSPSASPET